MIYLILGTESVSRSAAFKKLNVTAWTRIVEKQESSIAFDYIDQADLFGGRQYVLLRDCLSDVESRNMFKTKIDLLSATDTVFVFDEVSTAKNYLQSFIKASKDVYDCISAPAAEELSPFAFTKAFVRRDKLNAWIEWKKIDQYAYHETHGALWWQWKQMWMTVNSGGRSGWSKQECSKIGKEIALIPVKVYSSEGDYRTLVEEIILRECK